MSESADEFTSLTRMKWLSSKEGTRKRILGFKTATTTATLRSLIPLSSDKIIGNTTTAHISLDLEIENCCEDYLTYTAFTNIARTHLRRFTSLSRNWNREDETHIHGPRKNRTLPCAPPPLSLISTLDFHNPRRAPRHLIYSPPPLSSANDTSNPPPRPPGDLGTEHKNT